MVTQRQMRYIKTFGLGTFDIVDCIQITILQQDCQNLVNFVIVFHRSSRY